MNGHGKKNVDNVCSYINRRIESMSYAKESEVRDYIEDNCIGSNGSIIACKYDVRNIADILDVNEMCIYDMFVEEFCVEI